MKKRHNPIANNDPVYISRFSVTFPVENEMLSMCVVRIDRFSIAFNLNIDEECRLVPFEELLNLGKTKGELRIDSFRQDGKIFMSTVYHNCTFYLNIEDLCYHDYASSDIREMRINYDYTGFSIFDENNKQIMTTVASGSTITTN
jgi:hypothetical protein